MLKSYSKGFDLPPLMRDSLLANETAAGMFNALSPSRQEIAVSACSKMASCAEIDDYIRQTDNLMFNELCCRFYSEPDTSLL